MVDGDVAPIYILEAYSGSIKRVCRSTLAAEANGFLAGAEAADFVRSLLLEILHLDSRISDLENMYRKAKVACFTDAKSLEQALNKDAGQPSDKRVRILCAQIKELIGTNDYEDDSSMYAHWVDTSTMLADVLTKLGCEREPVLVALETGQFTVTPSQDAQDRKMMIRASRHARKQRNRDNPPAMTTKDGCENSNHEACVVVMKLCARDSQGALCSKGKSAVPPPRRSATRSVQERLKGKITVKAHWHMARFKSLHHSLQSMQNFKTIQYYTILHPARQAAQAQPAKEAASGVSALAGKTSVLTEPSEKAMDPTPTSELEQQIFIAWTLDPFECQAVVAHRRGQESAGARKLQHFQTKNILIKSVGGAMLLEAQKKSVKRQALIDRALYRYLPERMKELAEKRNKPHIPWYYEQAFRRMQTAEGSFRNLWFSLNKGYTMFHAVSKMGDFASWGMPFAHSQHVRLR
eukprot:s387_g5.t1